MSPAQYGWKNQRNFTIVSWILASAHIVEKANIGKIAWDFEVYITTNCQINNSVHFYQAALWTQIWLHSNFILRES